MTKKPYDVKITNPGSDTPGPSFKVDPMYAPENTAERLAQKWKLPPGSQVDIDGQRYDIGVDTWGWNRAFPAEQQPPSPGAGRFAGRKP